MDLNERIEKSQNLEWDIEHSTAVFNRAIKRLCDNCGRFRFAGELETHCSLAEPILKKARLTGGPILHTAFVFEFAVEIGLSENLGQENIYFLVLAALLHDIGFARIPPDRRKITRGEIEAIEDPAEREAKRKKAIEIRLEHMEIGDQMVKEMIRGRYWLLWEGVEEAQLFVPALIRIHDNPSIAELVDDSEEKKQWLFTASLPSLDKPVTAINLAPILREADRLWMLTVDGVITDLARAKRDKRKTPSGQLAHNAKRHVEEGNLYTDIFPDALERFGLKKGEPFYRTNTGKMLFRRLQEETRKTFLEEF